MYFRVTRGIKARSHAGESHLSHDRWGGSDPTSGTVADRSSTLVLVTSSSGALWARARFRQLSRTSGSAAQTIKFAAPVLRDAAAHVSLSASAGQAGSAGPSGPVVSGLHQMDPLRGPGSFPADPLDGQRRLSFSSSITRSMSADRFVAPAAAPRGPPGRAEGFWGPLGSKQHTRGPGG